MAAKKKASMTSVRRRVLSEWRGVDEPVDLTGYEHGLAEMLAKFFSKANFEDRCTEEDLAPVWEAAVGNFVAQHSRALSYERGILYVAVLQPSVRYTLQQQLKSNILPKLRTALPGRVINDVKFRMA